MSISKFICHSYRVTSKAVELGWFPGARYTNSRDIRKFDRFGFLDIDWENHDFHKHLQVVKDTHPILTVARDIIDANELERILDTLGGAGMTTGRIFKIAFRLTT